MKIKNLILILTAALSFTIFSNVVSAQNQSENKLQSVNCFDYYHFGEVNVNLVVEKESALGSASEELASLPFRAPGEPFVLAGTSAKFTGEIMNNESSPIVEADVYVKIFRKARGVSVSTNDNFLVDEFYAAKGLSVNAKKKARFSFDWQVPRLIETGDYYIAAYVLGGGRFNLSGLHYTDSISGSLSDFTVIGVNKGGISFNKSTVKVAGEKYTFTANPAVVDNLKPIKIDFSLNNTTPIEQRVPISYILYADDNLSEDNILNTNGELAVLAANSSKSFSYTINDRKHAAYYLVVEALRKDAKSLIGIRILRDKLNKPEISYLGVGSFPFVADGQNKAVACVNNLTSGTVKDVKLTLSVLDSRNRVISSGDFTGSINGAMTGFLAAFNSAKDNANFKIKAELYEGEKLVDETTLSYACEAIDPESCPKGLASQAWFVPIIVAIIVLAAISLIIFEKRKSKADVNLNTSI